ncbi:MAG: hypothetical protein SFZ23_13095 [Planctomycetota bacterium]|nr:hypothetical protein [Planctomycetota bacterium]
MKFDAQGSGFSAQGRRGSANRSSGLSPRLLLMAGASASLLAGVLPSGGCVVDDGRVGSSRSASKPAPPPRGAQPNRMLVSAAEPQDTDGNTFPDEILVTMYLFDDAHATASIAPPGSTVIRLVRQPEGEVLREWTFDEAKTKGALRRGPVGPAFEFRLSLLENGGDVAPPTPVDVVPLFTPTGGEPVRSRGTATVRLGRLAN